MDEKRIIMNFTVPPSAEDLEVMAEEAIENIPEELSGYIDGLSLQIEDFPDDTIQADLDLDDPYELLALFRSGKELAPGVEKKNANDDSVLILFRRPLLDIWCENSEDLSALVREVIIEELGKAFDFSDDEVDEMTQRHFQGML